MLSAEWVELSKHYAIFHRWWSQRGFPPANPKFLPPTGLIIFFDGKPIVGGFLFKCDANAAIIGNIVSDPDSEKSARSDALDYLILALTDYAKEEGFGMVCASTNLERLMGRYEKLGFSKTDEGVSHFGRIL